MSTESKVTLNPEAADYIAAIERAFATFAPHGAELAEQAMGVEATDAFWWNNRAGGVLAALVASEIVDAAKSGRMPSLASLAATARYVADEVDFQMMMLRRPSVIHETRRVGGKE